MDPEQRRVLSAFYREEFLKHLEHLEFNGIIDEIGRNAYDSAYRYLVTDLDRVCWHADFPAVAEVVLQGFEALTRISQLETSRTH